MPTCDRVSIWLFFNNNTELVALKCLDERSVQTQGEVLSAQDHPAYFAHILANEFLIAADARTHANTESFTSAYFTNYDIYSLLDVTFKKDYLPLGVICCERTKIITHWQTADAEILKKISLKASLFISDNIADTFASKSKADIIAQLNNHNT
ncbi:GAF domain-containing protein [Colwellia chukchiensis]|uniref:GAF domain-containing protein n=1 Tax=Colwellia chukchiensis TaxID=641665 RepID=UPI001301C6AB|nr:GAF domain-containing protein [Colwellia chukchiensis]